MENDTTSRHDPEALLTKGEVGVGKVQHLTTTDPNARLPDNNTGHGPQHDLRNPCGDEQSSSVHSEATRRLSSSAPGEQQEKKTSSYNSTSSAADNSKDFGSAVSVQKHKGNIQDNTRDRRRPTLDDARSAATCPNTRPPDKNRVPQYAVSTTPGGRRHSSVYSESASTPGGMQEERASYDSTLGTSNNKKGCGPAMSASPQGCPMYGNARSATMNPDCQLYAKCSNPQVDRIMATGSGQSLVAEEPNKDFVNIYTPTINIVIFGETGAGKSSVINLIAGENRTQTSNDALGCTFRHERHDVMVGEVACSLWDTTGLDEGSHGTVPADVAEKNLRVLIENLANTEGIHLVIYCIRSTRLTRALKHNYDLFYVAICRRKVPVALVVTGLEHQEGEMETWWLANKGTLRRSGMQFDAHACVTTLDVEDRTIRDRRAESRSHLHNLVLEYSKLPPWKMTPSFPSWILSKLRGVLRRSHFTGGPVNVKTTRKVIIYDVATNPQTLVQVSPGITALCQRFDGMIGNELYKFVRVDKHALGDAFQYEEDVGVLVFYTSPLVGDEISREDIAALETFYDIAGGHICPVIVILRGCNDEETARKIWDGVTIHSDIRVQLNFLPGEGGQGDKLNEMIERLCIEHVEVFEPDKAGRRFFQISQVAKFVKRARQFTDRQKLSVPNVRAPDGGEASGERASKKVTQPASGTWASEGGETVGKTTTIELDVPAMCYPRQPRLFVPLPDSSSPQLVVGR